MEKRTRKDMVLQMLKGLDLKYCYADYIAAKLNLQASFISAILNQLLLQGKVTKRKGHYRKVYYTLAKDDK